jgi:hypothetical protein
MSPVRDRRSDGRHRPDGGVPGREAADAGSSSRDALQDRHGEADYQTAAAP